MKRVKFKIKNIDKLLLYNKGNEYLTAQELGQPTEERSLENAVLLYTATGIHLFFEDDKLFFHTTKVAVKDLELPATYARFYKSTTQTHRSLYIPGFLIGRFLFKTNKNDVFTRKELKLQFDQLESEIARLFLLFYDIPTSRITKVGDIIEIRAPKDSAIRDDVDRLLNNLLPNGVMLGDYKDAHTLLAGLYESNIYEPRKTFKDPTNPAIITQLLASLIPRDSFCRIEFNNANINRLIFTNSISRNLPLITKFARYQQIPYMSRPVKIHMSGVKIFKKLHFSSDQIVTVPLGTNYQLGIKVNR